MTKISDKTYKLLRVFATRYVDSLSSGTTQPLVLECIDMNTNQKSEYVVKPYNAPRMSKLSSAKELIASWIAMELDIYSVSPAVVDITEDFIPTMLGCNGYINVLNSISLNFASLYERNTQELIIADMISLEPILPQICEIFAFDMFIKNPDRRKGKPNVLMHNKKLLIFDHELAFSDLDLILKPKEPWKFSIADTEYYQNHYFYDFLRGRDVNFYEFTDKLSRLNDFFWERVVNLIPEEWQIPKVKEIIEYQRQIINHSQEFSNELSRILRHA